MVQLTSRDQAEPSNYYSESSCGGAPSLAERRQADQMPEGKGGGKICIDMSKRGKAIPVNQQVCYSYQKSGQCKYGVKCKFSHEIVDDGANGQVSDLSVKSGFQVHYDKSNTRSGVVKSAPGKKKW